MPEPCGLFLEQADAHMVQEMALPALSRPALKNRPNSPARRSSGSGALVIGSRRRSRCAAMVMSPGAGSPLARTCVRKGTGA